MNSSHYDIPFLKPLDTELLHRIFNSYTKIITVEDGTIQGGLGSSISAFAAENRYNNRISVLGIPDQFIDQGTVEELHKIAKIDANSIVEELKKQH